MGYTYNNQPMDATLNTPLTELHNIFCSPSEDAFVPLLRATCLSQTENQFTKEQVSEIATEAGRYFAKATSDGDYLTYIRILNTINGIIGVEQKLARTRQQKTSKRSERREKTNFSKMVCVIQDYILKPFLREIKRHQDTVKDSDDYTAAKVLEDALRLDSAKEHTSRIKLIYQNAITASEEDFESL